MSDITVPIILPIILSLLVSLATSLLVAAQAKAKAFGTTSAAIIGSTLSHDVPAALRPWVVNELKALVDTTGPLSTASVTGVAAALMAKLPSTFPSVLKSDVVAIVADYVSAFDAGLTNIVP
jgi:hypothetical protein